MGKRSTNNMDYPTARLEINTGACLSTGQQAANSNQNASDRSASGLSPKSCSERPVVCASPPPAMQANPCMAPTGKIADIRNIASFEHNEQMEDRRVTVWNPITGKKLSGNAAPFRRNLQKYLASHPDWEECPDSGDSKKRRKTSSSSLHKRSKTEHSTPLYPWECLLAVARVHSQQVEEWTGTPDSMPSPRMHGALPYSLTQCMVG